LIKYVAVTIQMVQCAYIKGWDINMTGYIKTQENIAEE
jgi:hypothetical protein